MGSVLLFYHAVLAREKIYQINRCYLLAGLLFSLIVPFMPVGLADSLLNLDSNTELPQIVSSSIRNINAESNLQISANSTEKTYSEQTSNFEWIYPFLLWFYIFITLLLSFRMIRHLYRLQLKSMKNLTTFFKGHKVVLVDEKIAPHTFWKTIFVNKEQYENKEISEEVMIHELLHAEQNHSLDILIIEILKTIYWFNPILYIYKIVIQTNHEYIADNKVLSNGTDIADYQTLLLKMSTANSTRYLSTGLNFHITKRRFKMMTLNDSTYRSNLKTALIIPFFLILGITFGCEPVKMEKNDQTEKIRLELVNAETIRLNGKTISASQFGTAFSNLPIVTKETLVDLKLYENTPIGLVTDVQEVLRENGALRINFTIVQPNNSRF